MDQSSHQGGAHSLELLKLLRLVIDSEIRQLDGRVQHLIDPFLIHTGLPCPAHLFRKDIHGKGAGNITGSGAAHAVTDYAQQAAAVQLFHTVGILILAADTARIRKGPILHLNPLLSA